MSSIDVRNLVFDFGGVVVRWQPQQIINNFTPDEALRDLVKTAIFQHPDWLEMDRGTLSEDEAARRFSERTNRPFSEMAALLQQVRESLTPIPETVDLLHDLSDAGIPLYGLSNMPARTFEFLQERDPHWSVFRGVVISGQVKMMKPEAQIFELLSISYQLEPAETLFLDDLLPNIEAAKRAGFQTLLFDDPSRRCAELRRLFKLNVG
jgi:putative hydrolase of the HAD superfamily